MRILLPLLLVLISCGDNKTTLPDQLNNESSHAATAASTTSGILALQSFTQNPFQNSGCSGLFNSEGAVAHERVLVSNLKGTAFIKLNDQLMELKLVKQTNVNETTINELYSNGEVEIDLKITKDPASSEKDNRYKGVIIIRRDGNQEALSVAGTLRC
ncbi:MAG TPA: hypothetical protein VEZ55_12795 [Chitinophagaceae bacterium]|nr:hypothetical protein [Chitinophagaceae bacterium]